MFRKSISLILALITALTALSVLPVSVSAQGTENGAAVVNEPEDIADDNTEATEAVTENTEATETEDVPTEPAEPATEAPVVIDYPVITNIENLSEGAKITWDSYGGSKSYRIYYRKASTYTGTWKEKYGSAGWTRLATVNGNTYTHKGVADAEIGIYTVRGVDSDGNFTTNYNNQGWENCFYAAPVISAISFDDNGVHITWKESWKKHGERNGERYIVYRKTANTGWKRINEDAESVFTDETAERGVTYIYTLRMTNEDGTRFISGYNSGKTISFNAYPYINSIENTESGAKLSWFKYSGAAKYRVYYRTSSGWTRLAQVSGTSYTDTSVKSGQTRVYTVRALDSSDKFVSDYNTAGWSNKFYSAPVIKSLSNTLTGVKLTWTRASGAELYRVYRKTSGGWTRLTQTDASEYTDTNVASGGSYTYTLRMVSAADESFMSGFNSGKKITYVAAPVVKSVNNVTKGAEITWNKSAGASVYRVYYRGASGWTRLASVSQTEYTDTTVKNGETREYIVRCLDNAGNFVSDYYREGYFNTYYSSPVIKSMNVENGRVILSWDKTEGAGQYRVYRKTSGTSWTRIGQTDGGSYTDGTAAKGVKYTYTLRLLSADGERFESDYLSGRSITVVATPSVSSLTNVSNGVEIKWSSVKGAEHYRVYYKNSGSWTRLTSQSSTSFTDASVKDGENRTYTVRCYDDEGNLNSDYNRDGWSITYYAPPKFTSVKYSGGHYTLAWKKTDGVAGYRIYRKVLGDKDWTVIVSGFNGSSYTDNSSMSGKICTYTIRAQNASGAVISYYISDNPYYKNGSALNGTFTDGGVTYRFISGQPARGYYTENGTLYYYSNGRRVNPASFTSKANSADIDRAWWLYELMKASGASPNVSSGDDEGVFALAKKRGIISSYSNYDMYQPVTRWFVAQTMVSALGYKSRSVGYTNDVAYDSNLSTLAYYGYFIPDNRYCLYPDAEVTRSEFAYLLSELNLYKQLKGKNVISFGDSIMYGAGNDNRGIASIIGEKYGMNFTDYSVKGATMGTCSGRGHIPNQIRKAINAGKNADLILINGGTNDMKYTTLGSFTNGYDMSSTGEITYTEAFEKTYWMIMNHWNNVPVIYIRSHNMLLGTEENERKFGDRGIAIAEKWKAAPIDLYNNTSFNADNEQIANRYTLIDYSYGDYDGDTIHPTALGYAEFYLPAISDVLTATFN